MLVKIRDSFRKYKILSFFAILFVIGILFTIVGVISLLSPKVEGIEVEAKIVDIIKEDTGIVNADGYREFNYTVYVDYTDLNGNYHNKVENPVHTDDMVAGQTIKIKYDPNNPSVIVTDSSLLSDLIFIIIGLGSIAISIIKIVNTIKNKDINEFNRVNMNEASNAKIDSIKNNSEEENEYYFHFTGYLNQSYTLETIDRVSVYEARCDKMGVLSKSQFTFINHLTGKEEKHSVSHVINQSFDNFVTSSNFKIDGTNVWDILGKNGYSLEPHFKGLKSYFDIMHFGVIVAKIELAGTEAYKDGAGKLLSNMPIKGMFKVYAKKSDLDMVFLSAFILSKVDLF